MPANIIIYSTSHCPYCVRAKAVLDRKEMPYTEFFVDKDDKLRDEMIEKSKRYTVPQVFINDEHIGGFDDLYAFERSGQLNKINL